jgi:S-adenosylmethionine synthetase
MMDIMIDPAPVPAASDQSIEMVERKGLGHPDTICDSIAEALSVNLSQYYLDRFGIILHHNVDKALLCAGSSQPAFGGGEIIEPMEIILAGRATRTFNGIDVPIEDIAEECVRAWFRTHCHAIDPDRHVQIRCKIRPGSAELAELFARQQENGVLLANDTSCGVGFAPLTPLESLVGAVERRLNHPATKRDRPEIGEDVKVMGIRLNDRVQITLACALIDRYVTDTADYMEKKKAIVDLARREAAQYAGNRVDFDINAGDAPDKGSLYLTVTGTSAEAGDDGEVGRGNRSNGLITPFRPMTMEATAGKNPMSHVGKLYNVAANRLATAVVDSVDGVVGADCCLVSQIGRPVDDPAVTFLRLTPEKERSLESVAPEAEEVAHQVVKQIPMLWKELINGDISLF